VDYLYDMPLGWGDVRLQPDGLSFRRGQLTDGMDIIATSARGMGLVATAVLVAKALKEWAPSVAMMIGICGGRKDKGVSIGDIIAPDQCFHYQFGAFRDGKIERELRVENTEGQILDMISHMRRTRVMKDIQESVPRGFKSPNTILQCHVGPMASADLVVKDTKKFGEAIEADRRTIGVDMESYAFLRAAKLASVRWAFVAKAVTDFADAKKDDDYREYAKYVATEFAVRLARGLVDGLKA
jgi:nucleoside phosphorylase